MVFGSMIVMNLLITIAINSDKFNVDQAETMLLEHRMDEVIAFSEEIASLQDLQVRFCGGKQKCWQPNDNVLIPGDSRGDPPVVCGGACACTEVNSESLRIPPEQFFAEPSF